MTRDDIVAAARRHLNAPWRHRGRKTSGMDCAGLLVLVCADLEVQVQDEQGYSRLPERERFVDHLKAQFVLTRPPLKPGMIVVLRDGHLPCHTGILGSLHGRLSLIHASAARRQVVEETWDRHWQALFRCALDIPGVED
jgi:hypothetical protein